MPHIRACCPTVTAIAACLPQKFRPDVADALRLGKDCRCLAGAGNGSGYPDFSKGPGGSSLTALTFISHFERSFG